MRTDPHRDSGAVEAALAPQPAAPGDLAAAPRAQVSQFAHRGSPTANIILIVVYVILAGLTPVAARDAMLEMPPISAGVLRFSIAAILMLLTTYARPGLDFRGRLAIDRRDSGRFAFCALLCVPLNQICFLVGTKWSSGSHAGLFYGLTPVFVYLITLAVGYAPWSRRHGAASVIAFLGAAAIFRESFQVRHDWKVLAGDLLLLGAVATWAIYSVAVLPLANKYGAVRSLTVVIVIGAAMYLPAALVDGRELNFMTMSPRAIGSFVFITVVASYFNYVLWFIAITRIDINRVSVSANAAPIVAVVGAHYWLDEPVTIWLVVGGFLILLAITLANWDRIRGLRRAARSSDRASAAS
jgi:drug/metabolite transporter (DMT)-like permease